MYKYAFVRQCTTVDYMYLAICLIFSYCVLLEKCVCLLRVRQSRANLEW